ncbi:MAG: SBBP repeat-containing protein [Methanomassiliicoccales archaeon]|nr:MAG: SBBP repeat-containing protein [Methanomassiliicoccales archaeon]
MRKIGIIYCIISMILTVTLVFSEPGPVNADTQVMPSEEWVARHNGHDNGYDFAHAIATDTQGNVFVTGVSPGNGTNRDYLTIAYDPSGNELWKARYDGPRNGNDQASAIAVDDIGNIYVTGWSAFNAQWPWNHDYATVKYDPSGNELWVARYSGPGIDEDMALDIAVDSSYNVYVTGHSWGSIIGSKTKYDYATVAYDPSGNELWVARYNGPVNGYDWGRAVTVDDNGRVYVTGYSSTIEEQAYKYMDYATVAYDSSGNELWTARYNAPGNLNDQAYDIALDPSGNVYVTGTTNTVAYNSSGHEIWAGEYGGGEIAYDPLSGNVFVAGTRTGTGTPGTVKYHTVAYDTNGTWLWVRSFQGAGFKDAGALDIDSLGNVYVTGHKWNYKAEHDIVTIKYDPSGNPLWMAVYNSPTNNDEHSEDIAVDSQGNVYVTGGGWGNGTNWDYITIKYSEKVIVEATLDIDPDTLNLKSKGKWISAYITLPSDFDIYDINISTIMLNDVIPAEWGDIQGTTLMVKFDRSEVEDLIGLPDDNVVLTVTGELMDGTHLKGSDTIRVIEPP